MKQANIKHLTILDKVFGYIILITNKIEYTNKI